VGGSKVYSNVNRTLQENIQEVIQIRQISLLNLYLAIRAKIERELDFLRTPISISRGNTQNN